MSPNALLEKAKSAVGVTSDYALAHKLDISRSAISSYSKNKTVFDNRTCIKVASLLNLNPLELIAQMELLRAEKAHNTKCVEFWRDELEKIA